MTIDFEALTNKQLIEKAKENVAGGVDSTMRLPKYHLPLVIKKAKGIKVWDAEDNELLDMNMGYGPLIFGHSSPVVVEAIKNELDQRGSVLGFAHELSGEVAEYIKKSFPSIDLLRFSSSGSEVDQTAVRLARAFTKRDKIVIFEGHYHGSTDAVFHKYHAEIEELENCDIDKAIPGTNGMSGAPRNVIRLQWNDLETLRSVFERFGKEIAAVIMEPVMGNAGVIAEEPGYLKGVRDLTNKYGSLLIFDEIITGYRVARGGAQERYGVKSDITTLSKAMNGGVPISAIGGRRDIMEQLVSGEVFHGGVYSGNPLCLAATLAVQKEIDLNSNIIYENLDKASNMLKDGILQILSDKNIPVVVQNVGAMISMAFVESDSVKKFVNYREIKKWANHDKYILFQHELQRQGLYIHPNHYEPWYLSTLHTPEVIEIILDKIDKVSTKLIKDLSV